MNMEVFLYNSTVCRLCGEENDNGTFLYSSEDNDQNISDLVNAYLPIKVSDDGQLPRTICPGCTIQLEATVEFISLIINGQKAIRSLFQREKEYKKNILKTTEEEDVSIENGSKEVIETPIYTEEHPASLQVAGLDRPKRKRGRPPKKHKTPEELAQEAAAKQEEIKVVEEVRNEEPMGKRKRRHPERFKEVVQGKELEKIFLEEGVIDKEENEQEVQQEKEDVKPAPPKVPEVIGHTDSGELVVVVKGKGRGRPKGRLRQTREKCAICGKEFSCVGRYMSHVAAHGPVLYRCPAAGCGAEFTARVDFTEHQAREGHQGQLVIPKKEKQDTQDPLNPQEPETPLVEKSTEAIGSLPDLNPTPLVEDLTSTEDFLKMPELAPESNTLGDNTEVADPEATAPTEVSDKDQSESPSKSKKLKCPHCDKRYSSKQSKSLHIKVAHKGERAYICSECGAAFAYPRALALHTLAHARRKPTKGFACDLCGKVLNHPSSVAYHKEAEHANQRYVCNKCNKSFKHKQLLQRHQLVHSQHRPYACKICGAKFKTKANLINHQLLHSGIKKFQCEICKQRFAHKTSLTLHVRWHNGQKPYVCKICGKAFSQKGNLSEHLRIHTGEKPYRCVHCSRRFTTSSQHRLHLRRHMVGGSLTQPETEIEVSLSDPLYVETSEDGAEAASEVSLPEVTISETHPKFPCELCGSVLASERALVRHKKRHSQPLLNCPYCPKTFVDVSNLNKHKKQIHKQPPISLSLLAPQDISERIEIIEGDDEYTIVEDDNDNDDKHDERVIYVTYEMDDDNSPAYQIIDPTEQVNIVEEVEKEPSLEIEAEKLVSAPLFATGVTGATGVTSATGATGAVLLQEPKLIDTLVHHDIPQVTDERGNPLHFTMQDGTQLAITSLDGHSLHVITQDGQTIPVEINNFTEQDSAI